MKQMIYPMKFKTHFEREEEEEGEEEEESKPFEEEDLMTLAQFSRSQHTPAPSSLKAVVADDNINKSDDNKSCKARVSFAESVDVTPSARRAKEIQQSLKPEFPSFVKQMLKSHVSGGFWLGLPSAFSNTYMPKHDVEMTLVDENGEKATVKYIFDKRGLSAGWRRFSIAKKLVEGDSLIFQLLKTTVFKVYIVRSQALPEDDGARNLLQLAEDGVRPSNSGKAIKSSRKRRLPIPHLESQKQNIKNSPPGSSPSLGRAVGQHPGSGSEEVVVTEVLEGIRFSGSKVEFKDVKFLESFTIMVDGLIIDSEISDDVRAKYFELCCSQNDFLHKKLLKGFNRKLVGGIITEIISIADAIKASNLSTPPNEYNTWLDTLKGFEQLGMSVGFLRARLEQLIELAFDSEESVESRKYREAITKRARVEDNIRTLEDYILKFKNESYKLDMEIETLKEAAEKHELNFQAEVNAPW